MVMVNDCAFGTPTATSPACTSGNSAPSSIWWTATTRAASWRRRFAGESAHEVLGEHRQPLLGLLGAGETTGEHT